MYVGTDHLGQYSNMEYVSRECPVQSTSAKTTQGRHIFPHAFLTCCPFYYRIAGNYTPISSCSLTLQFLTRTKPRFPRLTWHICDKDRINCSICDCGIQHFLFDSYVVVEPGSPDGDPSVAWSPATGTFFWYICFLM